MKETILQYIQQYAPVFLMAVMMFIDKFGFGKIFSSFRSDVKSILDLGDLKKQLEGIKEDLRQSSNELQEIRLELKKEREILQRVKGAK